MLKSSAPQVGFFPNFVYHKTTTTTITAAAAAAATTITTTTTTTTTATAMFFAGLSYCIKLGCHKWQHTMA
jgi:hypothetical protein